MPSPYATSSRPDDGGHPRPSEFTFLQGAPVGLRMTVNGLGSLHRPGSPLGPKASAKPECLYSGHLWLPEDESPYGHALCPSLNSQVEAPFDACIART